MANYYGYTSIGRDFVDTAATDQVLIRADLINHFNTRLGERLMNPGFGCVVWDYIFDPFTDEVRYAVIENLQSIVESDPRVVLRSLDVAEWEHGLQVELSIAYVEGNQAEDMIVSFDGQSGKATY
jgi:phage baseplate assembly protein W|tara:strand:+ start:391 stop:765 length:375 start_codon:yes stop_codon:yes gene_type:complete